MSTQQSDPVLAVLARLEVKVDALASTQAALSVKADTLAATQASHAKAIKWITTAALLLVGAIGGPDAVAALTGGPV